MSAEAAERVKTWAPVVGWGLVIFGLSSIPGTQIPNVGFTFADKVAHVLVYSVLGALFYRALRRRRPGPATAAIVAIAALSALAYGVTDEVHQLFVPNRSADVLDLVADVVGGIVGAGAASLVFAARRTKTETATETETETKTRKTRQT